jgi:hypothetical protein
VFFLASEVQGKSGKERSSCTPTPIAQNNARSEILYIHMRKRSVAYNTGCHAADNGVRRQFWTPQPHLLFHRLVLGEETTKIYDSKSCKLLHSRAMR